VEEREMGKRISGPLRGTFHVPGSKSLTNRALVCAALAPGESVIENASDSTDSSLLANGLNQLGVLVLRNGSRWSVRGTGGRLFAPKFPIPVGNAGTTLRFFLSLTALAEGRTVLEGAQRMAERPQNELLGALQEAGVRAFQAPGVPRYEVQGGGLRGGEVHLRQGRSSQFLSSLLLAAPYSSRPLTIIVDGPAVSAPYVKMTLGVMEKFGISMASPGAGGRYVFASPLMYKATHYTVEPDASGASYGLGAAAIAGGEVLIPGMRIDGLQGDAGFARILGQMGCEVQQESRGLHLRRGDTLHGVDVEMGSMPDVVPTLVAVALFAEGRTRIRNVGHLRFKESDRLSALQVEIRKLGGTLVIHEDGLEVEPGPLSGASLKTYDDHRLVMTFTLIGLRVPGITVENPQCVAKSFPHFFEEMAQLQRGA
jgi:3-phosphoshikimate 1-carboxyvinyltransferase